MSPSHIVLFGLFEFDVETGELWTRGHHVRLQEQAQQVLRMLVSRPGEVITREAFRSALWPDETFVDFEAGLNVVVNRIRHVLGDSAASPRFIETVPRRGYRFIAPVTAAPARVPVPEQRVESAAAIHPNDDRQSLRARARRRLGTGYMALLLTAALVCGGGPQQLSICRTWTDRIHCFERCP